MGHANVVCRFGALAVALGVGATVATTGIGHASPADSGSPSAESSSTTGDSTSASAASTPGASGAHRTDGTAAVPDAAPGDSPTVTVRSTGGARAATGPDDDADIEGEADVEESMDAPTHSVDDEQGSAGAAEDVSIPRPGRSSVVDSVEPETTMALTTEDDEPAQRPVAPAVADELPVAAAEPSADTLPVLAVQATDPPAAPEHPALAWPVSTLTDVAGTVFTVTSGLVTAVLGPLAPGPESPSAALWAMLAYARREIGAVGQAMFGAIPNAATPLATVQLLDLPALVLQALDWLRHTFMNQAPVANSQEVILTLAPGQTSAPIKLEAVDPDGDKLTYSINEDAPLEGTVTINQSTGEFTFTPAAGSTTGTVTFSVAVSDDAAAFHLHGLDFTGHRATTTVTVSYKVSSVEPPTDPPTQPPTQPESMFFGVTIDRINGLDRTIAALEMLPVRPLSRIVFDEFIDPETYDNAVDRLLQVTDLMGEVLDSYYVKEYSLNAYLQRMRDYYETFGDRIAIWEVGNEVNGEWLLGPGDSRKDVVDKVVGAHEIVKQLGGKTAITLFYNEGRVDDRRHEMFRWVRDELPADFKNTVDYVFVSYYEDTFWSDPSQYVQPDWQHVFERLRAEFPNAKLGIGEIGVTDNNASIEEKEADLRRLYAIRPEVDGFVGGYFWWFFWRDMVVPLSRGDTTMIDALSESIDA